MARRQSKKDAGKPAVLAPRVAASGKAASPGISLDARLKAIESERDAAKNALATAEARIKELESRQADIANRIAWTLDSLHSLLEEKS